MNPAPNAAPPVISPAPPTVRTLRKLFLTLYVRGRGARGLLRGRSVGSLKVKTVGQKLSLALGIYVLFGSFALYFIHGPVFALAVYLHGLTFVFLGMFVSSSAGEILFNKEEGDILLHRPVTAHDLLWSKIRVLIEVSLWLAGALNLIGLGVGVCASDGGFLFPLVHLISTTLEALFCTSCIVLMYQLCLRWFGRERLDGFMTTMQVIVTVAFVVAGQLFPQLIFRVGNDQMLHFRPTTWWVALLPPAWFASLDDAVAGRHEPASWVLGAFALAATAVLLWIAFVKLAHTYEEGLQTISEIVSKPRSRSKRSLPEILVKTPPFRWFFHTPASRAAFLLTSAYLFRDREVKLRVLPGLAPMIIIPVVFLLRDPRMGGGAFGMAFSGAFLGMVPLMALDLLQYSQQWQASDIFRVAPMNGPAELCGGARWAVILLLAVPAYLFAGAVIFAIQRSFSPVLLLVPGVMAMPVASLVPALLRRGQPLSRANEEARSVRRNLKMFAVIFVAMPVAGLAVWSFDAGWFQWLVLGELALVIPLYIGLRVLASKLRWQPIE